MVRLARARKYLSIACACFLIFGAALVWASSGANAQDDSSAPRILVSEFELTVDSGFERYLDNVLEEAATDDYAMVVMLLDTPGGSLEVTRRAVDTIINAPVPFVVYVPGGGRAASAGTFIASAAHILAMAPISNIGAASPVTSSGEDLPDTLEAKTKEDATALIRSIAETRNRNAERLASTVENATSYSSSEAAANGIADLLATDLEHLLAQIDGMSVTLAGGEERTLITDGVLITERAPNFGERVWSFVTNPTVIFIAFVLGITLLLIEIFFLGFSALVFGTAGLILLALAIFGFTQLPLSWLGLLLLGLAVVLLVVELQAPGLGVASVAAAIALAVSSFFIFNDVQFWGSSLNVNLWFLIPIVILVAAVSVWLGYEVRRSRQNLAASELLLEERNLVGQVGVVSTELNPKGEVHINGEFWSAISATGESLASKRLARVVKIEGLHLYVQPAD